VTETTAPLSRREAAARLTDLVNGFRESEGLAPLEEDADLASATLPGGDISGEHLGLWREQALRFRNGISQENHAVYLQWSNVPREGKPPEPPALYTVSLPEGWTGRRGLSAQTLLVLAVADTGERPEGFRAREERALDFTLELADAGGRTAGFPLSRIGAVPPPVRSRFTKLAALDRAGFGEETEVHLQTFVIPLAAFAGTGTGFDPQQLRSIRFRFDRSPAGAILLDDLGFKARW
jgi:hypothetical protein